MLVIRDEQMRALARALAPAFEERACGFLREVWAEECAAMGADRLRALVREAAGRARRHGISGERDLLRFLNLVLCFGDDFGTPAGEPWAAALLSRPGLDAAARLDAMEAWALRELGAPGPP